LIDCLIGRSIGNPISQCKSINQSNYQITQLLITRLFDSSPGVIWAQPARPFLVTVCVTYATWWACPRRRSPASRPVDGHGRRFTGQPGGLESHAEADDAAQDAFVLAAAPDQL
jgi:hypothetical protein